MRQIIIDKLYIFTILVGCNLVGRGGQAYPFSLFFNHGVGSTDHLFVIILVVSKYVCIFAIVKQYSLENIWPESYERKAEQASFM